MGKKKQFKTQKPTTNFENQWEDIYKGIYRLFDFIGSDGKRPYNPEEYVTLYTVSYNLCTGKVDTGTNVGATELLYKRYKTTTNQYLTKHVVPSLKLKQGQDLLTEAVKRWRNHCLIVKWMVRLFNYLDRYYTKHNSRDSLRKVGLKCYQQKVYESIKKDMARALLTKILKEREGDSIDRDMMKDGIALFIEMGLNTLSAYETGFEEALLYETSNYYSRESAKWISSDSCPAFMKKAENRLDEEHARCRKYLHSTTEPKLIKNCEKELIATHQKRLMEMERSGLINLLEDHKTEDLSRMFRLFRRIGQLKPMADMTREFITAEGRKILKTHQDKPELDCNAYVTDLLDLHDKFSTLISHEFEKDSLFLEAMKDSFTSFVNQDLKNKKRNSKTTTAELLSTFCDHLMKNTERVGEDKLDSLLEKIVYLFGYLTDKDMFQEFYRRLLSKRLLVATSNKEAERTLISKLKVRQGASFTSKLEGMIKDKTLSSDMQGAFKEFGKKGKKLQIDFVPQVLTTGFWPAFPIEKLSLPDEFNECIKAFKLFYESRTQSRILKWVYSLGTCQITGRYASGDKDLLMSFYQAAIIVLFNDKEELSADDIKKSLGLPFKIIKTNLLALSVSKSTKILLKKGSLKNVGPKDKFWVNTAFRSKSRRVKIRNIVLKISEAERIDVTKTTNEDRKHAIEAAVVRIMKARKKMVHQKLVLEVSKQLMQHFRPDPKVIKKRIGDLIVREYLERDENKANVYNYKA